MKEKIIDKKICVVFFIFFFTLFFLQISYASNIEITKTSKSKITIGDELEVEISISNLENSEIEVSVKEQITNADPVQPESFYTKKCQVGFCVEPPFYMWNVTLSPLSTYTIDYKIKPLSFGNFSIPPTEVKTSSGELFYSNRLNVIVHCITNGICQPDKGENYFTCPEDCPSGSADDVCDLIKDGRCDPDCVPSADPDCSEVKKPICENGICESALGEDSISCPQDCPVKKQAPYWMYIITLILIIAVIGFLIYRMKFVKVAQ